MLAPMLEKLTFTASDGHRFDGMLCAAGSATAPVLVFFSALGTPAKVYGRFGSEMQEQGIHFCAPDWRGIDSSSVRASRKTNFGYRKMVELDMASVLAGVRQRLPQAPIWVGGHSLGGQLALLYGATHPDQIAGVVLIASGTIHMRCYPMAMRAGIRALLGLAAWSRATLGYFPGRRLGFGGREASGVMQDWGHVARTGRYEPVGSKKDYEMAIATLKRPVLAINFAADTWAPAPAGKGLLDKLQAQPGVHWCWSAADTKGVVLDHFSWLKHPELVAPDVARFMVERPRRR